MSTEQMLATAPKDVLLEPDIAYRPGGSKAWRLDLAQPKQKSDKSRPGIVFVHGGGWRSGDKRTGSFINGAIEYAQKGYVTITVNYRLTDEAPFPACIEDVKCAVRWFRAHAKKYNLDPDRVGAYGNSAGAHLVSILGLVKPKAKLEGDGPWQDQSSMVQAVAASATPTDFSLFGQPREGDKKWNNAKYDPARLARLSSPINHVTKDAPPFLLFHGTADGTVKVKHSDVFVKALKKLGNDVTYLRIDDAGHGVFNQHADKTKRAMEAFFAQTLRKD
jgi:acetyl esterase/lipase